MYNGFIFGIIFHCIGILFCLAFFIFLKTKKGKDWL
jgi:hypothetical protein